MSAAGVRRAARVLVLLALASCSAPPAALRWEGWSERCPLLVPADAARELAPFQPAPCPQGVEACSTLVTTAGHIVDRPLVLRGAGGTTLLVTRVVEGAKEWVLTDATGRVQAGLRQALDAEAACGFHVDSAEPGRWAFSVRGDGTARPRDSQVDGLVIFEPARRRLTVAHRDESPEVSTWTIGPRIARATAPGRRLEVLDGERAVVVHDARADVEQLPVGGAPPVFAGGRMYYEIGARGRRALLAWSPETSRAEPFRRWPDGEQRAAGNLGGDGDTLVWSQGEGRDERGVYARVSIYTADTAFTPPVVRRVADDAGQAIGAAPFVAGCGRASHWTPGGPIVVDLERGTTTQLPPLQGARWARPLGLDCDALYVEYTAGGRTELARVQL